MALRFAGEGAHLVLVARTVGGLEETDDRVRAAGGSATLVPLDLREHAKIDELAAALYERYGRLDILVGNAAEFGTFSPLAHIDPKLWGEIIDLDHSCRGGRRKILLFLLRGHRSLPLSFFWSRLGRPLGQFVLHRRHQLRVREQFLQRVLGGDLAVHIAKQIR